MTRKMAGINLVHNNLKTESWRVKVGKCDRFTEAMSDGRSHNEQEFIMSEADCEKRGRGILQRSQLPITSKMLTSEVDCLLTDAHWRIRLCL